MTAKTAQEIHDAIWALPPEQRGKLADQMKEAYIKAYNRERPASVKFKMWTERVLRGAIMWLAHVATLVDSLLLVVTFGYIGTSNVIGWFVKPVHIYKTMKDASFKEKLKAFWELSYAHPIQKFAMDYYAVWHVKYLERREEAEKKLMKEQDDAIEEVARQFFT